MDFIKEIDLSLRAKATLILTVSPEEERITEDLKALCQTTGRNCIVWDIAEGFSLLAGKNVEVMECSPGIAVSENSHRIPENGILSLRSEGKGSIVLRIR